MVYSHLCWQCYDKTRKYQEHINTLRKKEKLIFQKPILELKTKNLFSAGKGTRVLVPGHQNSGAPTFFFGVFLMVFSHLCWQCSDKTRKCQEHINTLRKKEKLIFLKPILEIKTKNLFQLERAPEFWCLDTRTLVPPQFKKILKKKP